MKLIIILICILLSQTINAQSININSFEKLEDYLVTSKKNAAVITVWGKFLSYGKFSLNTGDKYECNDLKKILKKEKFTTSLGFTLFTDSILNYYPITNKLDIEKLYLKYEQGDIIKLKVRVIKNCTMINKKAFFIIEDIM